MPRKAATSASVSASRSSSKRPAQDTPSRQSKRTRATARRSYAEPATDDDEDGTNKVTATSDEAELSEASGFEDPSEGSPTSESEQDESGSDEDTKPNRGRSAKKNLPLHRKHADEKELWKQGAKLAPGTQLIIKKPKARDAGDTPYTDGTSALWPIADCM